LSSALSPTSGDTSGEFLLVDLVKNLMTVIKDPDLVLSKVEQKALLLSALRSPVDRSHFQHYS
jgi:hypothetical protein